MIASVSIVLLWGVLIWILIRYTSLRAWQAVACILFGLYVGSTPLTPTSAPRSSPSPASPGSTCERRPAAPRRRAGRRRRPRVCDRELSDELADLHAQHTELRARYADLIAAGRAALSAARDGETDALAYLADELTTAHDQHDIDPPRWAVDR